MGADGGVIAIQRKFMRHGQEKKKDVEGENKNLMLRKRVTTCSLSDEPLSPPIVSDRLGNLFNKEVVIQKLLSRTIPATFSHIESLKDIFACNLAGTDSAQHVPPSESKSKRNPENRASGNASKTSIYTCPITFLELNGKNSFVLIQSCGCVYSEKAMREIENSKCLLCSKEFQKKEDVVYLVPASKEKISFNHERLREMKEKKNEKKNKKGKSKSKEKKKKRTKSELDTTHGVATQSVNKRARVPSTNSSANSSVNIKGKTKLMEEVSRAVDAEKSKSDVYASLFSKGSKKKGANDLLMTVGGMRYTLG